MEPEEGTEQLFLDLAEVGHFLLKSGRGTAVGLVDGCCVIMPPGRLVE